MKYFCPSDDSDRWDSDRWDSVAANPFFDSSPDSSPDWSDYYYDEEKDEIVGPLKEMKALGMKVGPKKKTKKAVEESGTSDSESDSSSGEEGLDNEVEISLCTERLEGFQNPQCGSFYLQNFLFRRLFR